MTPRSNSENRFFLGKAVLNLSSVTFLLIRALKFLSYTSSTGIGIELALDTTSFGHFIFHVDFRVSTIEFFDTVIYFGSWL